MDEMKPQKSAREILGGISPGVDADDNRVYLEPSDYAKALTELEEAVKELVGSIESCGAIKGANAKQRCQGRNQLRAEQIKRLKQWLKG